VILVLDALPVTRDGAQADARRELSKGIYHRYDDPWPVRAFKAVAHWIADLFDRMTAHAPGGGAGAFGLLLAVVVLLAVARWQLGPVRRERRVVPGPVLGDETRSAADHRRAAERAAGDGRWDEAVVERMRAVARHLEERGVLDARPGRTADELSAEVIALLPAVTEPLRLATATFDEVAYGRHTADASSYRSVVVADEMLGAQRPSLAGRPA
jgi:hypothetical protein